MADLSELDAAADEAIQAVLTAPLLVRPYLKPLLAFIRAARNALKEINAQAVGGSEAGGDQQKEP